MLSLFPFLLLGLSLNPASSQDLPVAKGAFAPTMNSLTRYRYPTWFRDAKFGIWAHWGPQSTAEYGNWYARNIYDVGTPPIPR